MHLHKIGFNFRNTWFNLPLLQFKGEKKYIFINAETVFDKTFICDHTLRKLKTELSKFDKECK